eukprot:4013066-Amphidinium_carterae.1
MEKHRTRRERGFENAWVVAIFCNLFGLIFGSSLVSILSMTTLQYREAGQEWRVKTQTVPTLHLQKSDTDLQT